MSFPSVTQVTIVGPVVRTAPDHRWVLVAVRTKVERPYELADPSTLETLDAPILGILTEGARRHVQRYGCQAGDVVSLAGSLVHYQSHRAPKAEQPAKLAKNLGIRVQMLTVIARKR